MVAWKNAGIQSCTCINTSDLFTWKILNSNIYLVDLESLEIEENLREEIALVISEAEAKRIWFFEIILFCLLNKILNWRGGWYAQVSKYSMLFLHEVVIMLGLVGWDDGAREGGLLLTCFIQKSTGITRLCMLFRLSPL